MVLGQIPVCLQAVGRMQGGCSAQPSQSPREEEEGGTETKCKITSLVWLRGAWVWRPL